MYISKRSLAIDENVFWIWIQVLRSNKDLNHDLDPK